MTERLNRPGGRVVVVDEEGKALLCRVDDPYGTGPALWITPGGGLEGGESIEEGAARELLEETGLAVDPGALGRPVAVCRGEWEFRGVPLYSDDWFFVLRTTRFEPTDDGLTALEREVHAGWRWWSADEIEATDEAVLPSALADVVRRAVRGDVPDEPVELPWTTV